MRAVMVVRVEPGGESVGALLGVVVRLGVSPFAHRGLDKAFGLAVGAGSIRTGKDVPHPAAAAQVGNRERTVGGAVVGHDAGDRDPKGLEVIEGAREEGSGGFLALIGQDFGVGQARMVVDAYVGNLEAGAVGALLMGAGNARADAMEAAELFGVEMEQVAGRGVLVALGRWRGVQCAQPGQPGPLEQAAYGGEAECELGGDVLHQEALAAQCDHLRGHFRRRRPPQPMRPRAAVEKSGRTFAGKTPGPLAHRLVRHTHRRRNRLRPFAGIYPPDQSGSTMRRGARILMNVHPGRPPESVVSSHLSPSQRPPGRTTY